MARHREDYSSIKDAVSCVDALNAVFFCAGPGHQFDRYYKDGTLDGCTKQLEDMKFCLKLKAAGPEETKRLLASLLQQDDTPPSSSVWSLKKHASTGTGSPGRS